MDKDGSEGEPRMDYYPKKLLDVYVNRGELYKIRKTRMCTKQSEHTKIKKNRNP